MRLTFAVIPLLFTTFLYGQEVGSHNYDPAKLYPVDSLRADLKFLQVKLEKMHPGLYRYATKPEITGLFDSLHRVIRRPMNEQQFLSLLMLVQARIRNGHTMFLHGDLAWANDNATGRFLPFDIQMIAGKMLITRNYSADSSVGRGSEVKLINGVSSAEIWRQLMIRQIRDGYNETYPEWILDHYFSSYYGYVFGRPNEFRLELKNSSGDTVAAQVSALTKNSIDTFRRMRYPGRGGPGISLRELDAKKVGVVRIRSFDPKVLDEPNRDYRKLMDSIFHRIRQDGDTSLILDLRDNQGGDFAPVRYLLSYLNSKPTQFLLDGSESRLIGPAVEHFPGRLVVLINGGSFSATAMLAATLRRDRRAIFVGEETGGNPFVISGDPEEVVLPHSGISCQISTKTYRITEGVNTGHGLIPEYPVKSETDDWLTGRDRAMETAERLAKRE
jgi:hypothetical protein